MPMAVQPQPAQLVGDVDAAILDAQRAANAELLKMPHPDPRTPQGLLELRALIAPPQRVPELTPTDVVIEGPGGDLRLHIFVPDAPARGLMVRIHGGGWIGGAPEDDEALNDHICRTCEVAIVSPEYRLAPENGVTIIEEIEDCLAAVRWAHAQAASRFGTDRLMIAGTSGGAHLAAATLLRLRDTNDPAFTSIIGAHFDSGPYDVAGSPSQRLATEETLIVTPMWLEAFRELAFPGRDSEMLRDWSDDLLWSGGSLGTFKGKAAFKNSFIAHATGAWKCMHLEVHEVIASGDKVVLRFTNSGTNVGPFMGNPPTGKHAEWLGIGIYTVRDGRITEGWFAEDILGMLIQLDVLAAPA